MRWPGSHNISVADAHAAAQNGAVLIDVRTAQERTTDGTAAGARHIPLDQLAARAASLRDHDVLVICRSGRRSAHAAAMLRREGIAAKNVKGGILAWKRHGLPEGTRSRGRKSR